MLVLALIHYSSLQFVINSCCQPAAAKDAKDKDIKDKDIKDKNIKDKNIKDNDTKAKDTKTKDAKVKTKREKKSHLAGTGTNWVASSKLGAKLIAERKFSEAEALLSSILPQAKQDDQDSIELAVCLLRYGIALHGNRKYTQSLHPLHEAMNMLSTLPSSPRQHRAMFEALGTTAGSLVQLGKFDLAEPLARRSIAYAIAFPNVTAHGDMRRGYLLLRFCLENQKKLQEAHVIADVLDYLPTINQ